MSIICINPTKTIAWEKLKQYKEKIGSINLKREFANKDRFDSFSINFKNILFDYSKGLINSDIINLLIQLANETYLKENIEHLFTLGKLNVTEDCPAVHTMFRSRTCNHTTTLEKGYYNCFNILEKIKDFSNKITSGQFKGYTNKSITDIVSICIGGPLLGTQMVCKALEHLKTGRINIHFVSNVDSFQLLEVLKTINIETTIFIITSKSFSTTETLSNAEIIKNWFISKTNEKEIYKNYFFAITSNKAKALEFGIEEENIFITPKEINGRFSIWSAVGLIISLYIGYDNFESLLVGARNMDDHFRYTDLRFNMPVIAALLNIWYGNFYKSPTYAILPYSERLGLLPAYIQQLEMESNGKSVDRSNCIVNYNTSPIIWGGVGTNSQHSFFQLLHQGTHIVPCDFIVSTTNDNNLEKLHNLLLSNLIAQVRTLAFGNNAKSLFKRIEGNKPSNTIIFKKLDAETLGSILTFYEHKTFTQGVILNICSFDQFGVETSKEIAKKLLSKLNKNTYLNDIHPSVRGLVEFIKNNTDSCVEKII